MYIKIVNQTFFTKTHFNLSSFIAFFFSISGNVSFYSNLINSSFKLFSLLKFVKLWHHTFRLWSKVAPNSSMHTHTNINWRFEPNAVWLYAWWFGIRVLSHIRMNFTLNCHLWTKEISKRFHIVCVFLAWCTNDFCYIEFYTSFVVAWIFQYTATGHKINDTIGIENRQTKPVTSFTSFNILISFRSDFSLETIRTFLLFALHGNHVDITIKKKIWYQFQVKVT